MALQIWIPFIGDNSCSNQGIAGDLTVVAQPTLVSGGKIGAKAISSGQYKMSANQTAAVLNDNAWSLAFWIYINADDGTSLSTKIFGGDSPRQYTTFLYPTVNDLHTSWYNDTNFAGGTVLYDVLPSYTWTHVAITFKQTDHFATIYINGSAPRTFSLNSFNGSDYNRETTLFDNTSVRYFNDYRVYDHCLSPKEVKEISKALVLHYPLNDAYVEGTINLANQSYMGGWINSGSRTVNYNDTTLPNVPTSQQVYSMTATSDGSIAMTCGLTGTVASKTIVASVYVWLDGAQNGFGVYVRSNKTDDSVGYLQYNGTTNAAKWPTKQWIRIVSDAITMPSDATTVYLCTYLGVNTQYVAMNGWQIEEKDHATPFTSSTRTATTVYDCSGYSNNGTIKGSLSCVDDSPRYNVSTQVSNGNNINFNFNPSFVTTGSISFWAKYTSPGSCGTLPFTGQDGNYYIMACSSTGSWYNSSTVSGTLTYYKDGIVATNPRETGEWHHFVITGINLSSWTAMYLNKYGSDNSCWNSTAQFSDIRIYNTVLSADDIKELYNTSAIVCNNGAMLAYELEE